MARKLTVTQHELLRELAENADSGHADGGWYIRHNSRPERTVRVLVARGLARCDEAGGYGAYASAHYVITDEGRAYLAEPGGVTGDGDRP